MGLLTDSNKIREQIQNRNLYVPNNVYDLNADIITKSLNYSEKLGFDLRSNVYLNFLERITDATPLVNIGYQRFLIEFGRRVANNLFYENQNVYYNGKSYKPNDFDITAKDVQGNILKRLTDLFGYNSPITNVDSTQKELYDTLGKFQKDQLNINIDKNKYSNPLFETYTVIPDGGNLFTESDDYRNRIVSSKFTDYSSNNLNVNSNPTVINNVGDTVIKTISIEDINGNYTDQLSLGNTHNSMYYNTGVDKDDISDEKKFLLYGMSDDILNNRFLAQRGLLYYTNKLVQNEGKNIDTISNTINPRTKNYGVNEYGETIYKGSSKCRSYTVNDQYDETSKFIRFSGNKNDNSVLKESVMPRLIYKSTDKDDETRRTMFSIENLAYFENKTSPKNIPAYEVGPLGGRIMWFMPYALTFSDNTNVTWEAKDIIGRIEKMYSYNGIDRRCSLSFMLVIDYPPQLNNIATETNYKRKLASFIQGCDLNVPINNVNKQNTQTIVPNTVINNTVQQFPIPSISYYFDNDIDNVENSIISQYEINGLNNNFVNNVNTLSEYIIQQISQGNKLNIDITSQASSLFTADYNAALSFRRGASLVKYIIKQYNQNITYSQLRESSTAPQLNIDDITQIDVSNLNKIKEIDIKNGKTIIVSCNNSKVLFIIKGSGELNSNTPNTVIDKTTLESPKAKSERNSKIHNIISEKDDSSANNTTNNLNNGNTISNSNTTTSNISNTTATNLIDTGYDFIDYTSEYLSNKFIKNNAFDSIKENEIKPIFHSQTPYDLIKRYIFLHQLTRPFSTEEYKNADGTTKQLVGSNSVFGRMPVIVLRIGDLFNTKALVNSLNFSFDDSTWDFNPEGMGAIPMFCKVSMDLTFIGGQSLESPIDILQTANDYNFVATSSYSDNYSTDKTNNFYNENKQQFIKSNIQVGKQKTINKNYLNKLKTT